MRQYVRFRPIADIEADRERRKIERMWRCTRCESEFDADQAEANLDDFGLHFICPVCGRRNRLRSLGEQDGFLVLEQIDGPE